MLSAIIRFIIVVSHSNINLIILLILLMLLLIVGIPNSAILLNPIKSTKNKSVKVNIKSTYNTRSYKATNNNINQTKPNNITNTNNNRNIISQSPLISHKLFELYHTHYKPKQFKIKTLSMPNDINDNGIDALLYYRAELLCLKSGLKISNKSEAIQQYLINNPIRSVDVDAKHFTVTQIEYVLNPELLSKYENELNNLPPNVKIVYSFHGTVNRANIESICRNGFKKPGDIGYKSSSGDIGWYGGGVYSSEFPSKAIEYSHTKNHDEVLLCVTIVGKQYKLSFNESNTVGRSLEKSYDSHISDCKQEIVTFYNYRILPVYCIKMLFVKY